MPKLYARVIGALLSSIFCSALPLPYYSQRQQQAVDVIAWDIAAAYAKFSLPVHSVTTEADDALVFELLVNPSDGHSLAANVSLNGHFLELAASAAQSYVLSEVEDASGVSHDLNIITTTFTATPEAYPIRHVTQTLAIHVTSIDGRSTPSLGFIAIVHPMAPNRLQRILREPQPHLLDLDHHSGSLEAVSIYEGSRNDDDSLSNGHTQPFDLIAEAESLMLLEAQAGDLRMQIEQKKFAISNHLREHRDHLSLKHLLEECDTLVCAAKVIAQRICDKIGMVTEPAFGYARMHSGQSQGALAVSHELTESSSSRTSNQTILQSSKLQLLLTKNDTSEEYKFIDLVNPTNPLMQVLSAICAILGLSALFAFIRRKCMSMRSRVDRAADREERLNARAYRRAARRATMRKRWDGLLTALNCFQSPQKPRTADYEEKRALIVQEAFLEQLDDVEQAAKGEIMEAEIRELRHAHEIVASLIRVDENRFDLVTPVHDPPPQLVPIPYASATRSWASTHTLPSYTSEDPPSYTSRQVAVVGSGSSVISTSSSTSTDGEDDYSDTAHRLHSAPSSSSPSSPSKNRRCTPASSILETSSRASEETMRTR